MPATPVKVWGTTVQFNGYMIGRIKSVGRASQARDQEEIFTCDSEDENAEYLSKGITRGQVALDMLYDGVAAGTDASLQNDFDDDTDATIEFTYKNGSKKSLTAKIIGLDMPGGEAGGVMEYSVSFQLSGPLTNTPAAAA